MSFEVWKLVLGYYLVIVSWNLVISFIWEDKMNISFFEVVKTSFPMAILVLCSITALCFAIERWWYFKKIDLDTNGFMETLRNFIGKKKFDAAIELCQSVKNPLGSLMEVAVSNNKKPKSQLIDLMNATRLDKRLEMEQFVIVIGTMGTICPFIGLFGTVVGIIRAFQDLAVSGSGGPSVVASGISEALITTAAGLAVAIPSVVLYNYFMKRIKKHSIEMESNQIRMLVYLVPEKGSKNDG